ncbi:MAG: tetratricopeptide repeat protein [Rhodoferax sp.]|nr:tetratricopeptide repeat protein [Rhodoferax sp.]
MSKRKKRPTNKINKTNNSTDKPAEKSAGSQVQGLFSQALELHRKGDLPAAKALYTQLLSIEPKHADTLHLLGVLVSQERDFVRAAELIGQAILLQPHNAAFHCNLGTVLLDNQQLDAALASLDRAIALQPDFAQAHYNKGNVLRILNQLEAAVASYGRAIACKPGFTQALFNQGNVLVQLHQYAPAEESYLRALAINPNNAESHYRLGIARYKQGRFEQAAHSFGQTIALAPTHADAYFDLGNTYKHLQQTEAALVCYARALEIRPNHAQAYLNRGIALHELKQLPEAIACYDAAIALKSDYAKAHWNKSLALLTLGDYARGWRMYGWRWHVPDFITKPLQTSRPVWNEGGRQRVLLWAEQGLGEELMFSSLIPEFSARCRELIVLADTRLIPLLSRSFPREVATFIPSLLTVPEDIYDVHIPMGNVCQYLRASPESFSSAQNAQNGYLRCDTQRSMQIRHALQKGKDTRLCGISWYCKNPLTGAQRSIALRQLVSALAATGYALVNLQYGDTAAERAAVFSETGVEVLHYPEVDNLQDIDGLAAVMGACDCVVSIDNSTVHLAGALGKDVRVLLPYLPDWRWQFAGSSSLWYPSMRLYRQDHPGDWQNVLESIVQDMAG